MGYSQFSVATIINITVQIVLFFFGLFINIKVVLVCWKDRDGKAWRIQIAYSISIVLFFAFHLPFSVVTNAIPHLSDYTGDWFCNLATIVICYGINAMTTSSLLIAIMKYVFIVHPLKALRIGHEKIEKMFLTMYLALSFVMAIVDTITKDFEHYIVIRKCFALSDEQKEITWKSIFLCNFDEMGVDVSNNLTLEIVLQTICVVRSILEIVIASNILEAFFYYKIFKTMKR